MGASNQSTFGGAFGCDLGPSGSRIMAQLARGFCSDLWEIPFSLVLGSFAWDFVGVALLFIDGRVVHRQPRDGRSRFHVGSFFATSKENLDDVTTDYTARCPAYRWAVLLVFSLVRTLPRPFIRGQALVFSEDTAHWIPRQSRRHLLTTSPHQINNQKRLYDTVWEGVSHSCVSFLPFLVCFLSWRCPLWRTRGPR